MVLFTRSLGLKLKNMRQGSGRPGSTADKAKSSNNGLGASLRKLAAMVLVLLGLVSEHCRLESKEMNLSVV